MSNISDSLQCSRFLSKLVSCERNMARLTDWEQGFIANLREKFNAREDMADMGVTPWNPTANQWNTLSEIAERYS